MGQSAALVWNQYKYRKCGTVKIFGNDDKKSKFYAGLNLGSDLLPFDPKSFIHLFYCLRLQRLKYTELVLLCFIWVQNSVSYAVLWVIFGPE